jgi:hypothetical protein
MHIKTRKRTNLFFLRDNILALQLQLTLLDQLWHLVRDSGGNEAVADVCTGVERDGNGGG